MPVLIPQSVPLVVTLLLLLLAARVLGEITERAGLPALIGEVLAGIILGPSLLGWVSSSSELKVISDLGVFMLVIVAGLEIQPDDLRNAIRGKSIWIAILGFIIPFATGVLAGIIFNFNTSIAIFLGLCFAITALPLSVRILIDLGQLNSDVGRKIISVAIFNDVIALIALGVILDSKTSFSNLSSIGISIAITILKLILIIIGIIAVYKLFELAKKNIDFLRVRANAITKYLRGKETLYAMVIVFVLLFAALSELAGLHFIVGAFFASIFLNKEILGTRNFLKVRNNTNTIAMGFLAPIFFASTGVLFSFGAINNYLLLGVIIIMSLAGKFIGGYAGGYFAGLEHSKSITLGVGINVRGIMDLVIANIAYTNGFINHSLFSILIVMGLFSTLISPLLMKKAFNNIKN